MTILLDGLITGERCFEFLFGVKIYQPLSDLLLFYGWTWGFLKLDLVWVIAGYCEWAGWLCLT